MHIIDVGHGHPIVLIPGVQGRWEWVRPAVDALAARTRVITFSLADEPTAGAEFDERNGFSCYVEQVAAAMTIAGIGKAAICGVSYGGLIAAAFAARHPERVSSLILVSALHPSWTANQRTHAYLRAPWLMLPVFLAGAAVRAGRELVAATPSLWQAAVAGARHGLNVVTHMGSPARMAMRVRLLAGLTLEDEIKAVHVPTLVVTGDASLDRVVPVAVTREYLRTWPHATAATLASTGHLGMIVTPRAFSDIVIRFVESTAANEDQRRQVV